MSTETPLGRKAMPAKCRSCNRPMYSPLFCADCRTLHPAEGVDHFALLGVSASYDLDPAELRQAYLHCSRDIHPDRHGECAADAALSMRSSARLNEAYRVLNDPVLRAEYLLELAGGASSAEDKSVPEGVLAQVLILREEIEEARAAGDAVTLTNYVRQVHELHEDAVGRLGDLARQLPGTEELRQSLRQTLNAVRYYQKLLEQIQ
ncbi:MAG: Fe-S protein assembly co-chaperone HscB [Phycisphaerae bacterium]|jgi:molecular chaperone HscB